MWCHLSIYRKLNILLLGWTQNRYIIVRLIILLTFYSDDSFEISSSKKELPLRIPFEVFWTYYFDVYTIWFLSVVGVSWRRKLDPKLYIFCTASLNYEKLFPLLSEVFHPWYTIPSVTFFELFSHILSCKQRNKQFLASDILGIIIDTKHGKRHPRSWSNHIKLSLKIRL